MVNQEATCALKKINQNKNMNMDEKNTSKDEVKSSQY